LEYSDNSGGSDGALYVKLIRGRYRLQVTLSSVAITSVGDQVYASADDTLTLTPGSNTRVGVVDRYVTTDTAIVEFQTMEIAAIASDLTALLSDLALNSYSDFNVYVSDTVANASDIVVLKSDMTAEKSDAVVFKSDITANDSDITVLKSDMTAEKSDAVVFKSDIAANDSDIVVIKSDITANDSDLVTRLSDLRVCISDAQVASGAGDWANVSDIKVTVTELLAAFSDALG